MTIYFDLCCLKRPFDDQTDWRVASESAAVLRLLEGVDAGQIVAVRSVAHELENSQNPDPQRAAAVAEWLGSLNPLTPTPAAVTNRVRTLESTSLHRMDAFHVAWAEHLGAAVFATTDDKIQSWFNRVESTIRVRVVNPVTLVQELMP